MNKVKIRILGSLLIVICLCLSKLFFAIDDYYDFHKTISIDGQTQDILKQHPLISRLYQYYYDAHEQKTKDYMIKNIGSYSTQEQKTLKNMQSLYSEEIQKLIDKKILSSSILESSKQPYQVTFGTLTYLTKGNSEQYLLNQIYRLNSDNDKTIDFIMDKETHKIISLSISQKNNEPFDTQNIKDLLWYMIEYLELDDIDDWNYNQNGYESYKAKLHVTYQKEEFTDMQTYTIAVNLLYSSSSSSTYFIYR